MILGVAFVALSVVTFTAFADWTKTSSLSTDVNTGTILFTLADPGNGQYLNVTANDVAPGDTIDRVVDATVGGTIRGTSVALTTAATAGAAEPLYTNDANGLQLRIDKCSQAWTVDGVTHAVTCGGATSVVYAPGGNPAPVNDSDVGVSLSNISMSNGGTLNHLRVELSLPNTNTDYATYGNKSVTIQFTFSLDQRAATHIG